MKIVEVKHMVKKDLWYVYPMVHNFLAEASLALTLLTKPDFETWEDVYDGELTYIHPCSSYTAELICSAEVEKAWVVTGIPAIEDDQIVGIATTDVKEIEVAKIPLKLVAIGGLAVVGVIAAIVARKPR